MEKKFKSPLKSHGFWGFILTILVPGILTLGGVNTNGIVPLITDFVNVHPIDYTTIDWGLCGSQVLGIVLTVLGLTSKNRKPLKFGSPDENK